MSNYEKFVEDLQQKLAVFSLREAEAKAKASEQSLREATAKAEAAEFRAENERILLEWTRAEKSKTSLPTFV